MGQRDRLKSNNKQQILGSEWSMSKVGTPPHHNSDKPHGLVDSINNNNNFTIIVIIINYRDIGISLLLKLLIGILLNLKASHYITIMHISCIHFPTNQSVVLGSLICKNQPKNYNQIYVSTRHGWCSSDIC